MMKVMIDIPIEIYKRFMSDWTGTSDVLDAVRNGTPLPDCWGSASFIAPEDHKRGAESNVRPAKAQIKRNGKIINFEGTMNFSTGELHLTEKKGE